MNLEIITKADLNELKRQIVTEVVQKLKQEFNGVSEKEYLKTMEVKKILGCSDSKLEAMRRSGKLPFTKLQGTIYYNKEDVYKLFENLD